MTAHSSTGQLAGSTQASPHRSLVAVRGNLFFLIFKHEKKTRSCSWRCKAESVVDAVRRAVTGTVWRTHEFAVLLLAQRPAPVLGWKHYSAAGYSGTSEAEGKLWFSQLLGSAAQFEVRMAQRAETVSSWEKGSYWALWFALEPKPKLKSLWAPSRGLTVVSVFLFGSTSHVFIWIQIFISKIIERWTIWLHKGVREKIFKNKNLGFQNG